MRIWLINHYAVPPQYYPLARQTYFAKNLMKLGHKVTIISASSVHNSSINLIIDKSKWRREIVDGIDHVYIKCCDYEGNGLKRILNMYEFSWKLPGVCRQLEKPDAIVATSMPPMSCAKGIKLSKKYNIPGIAEIADLWPESLIAYDIAGPRNPAVIYLRRLEKWIYKKADAIVFTMGGGYDYIKDQGWQDVIPYSKVYHINNGVDLETFDHNKEQFIVDDPDLNEDGTYKIVYTGSLRKANEQIYMLFDAIKMMQGEQFDRYRFLIYGKGDLEDDLRSQCEKRGYKNVKIKGFVDKKYIPYILSKCDLNILNCVSHDVLRYGGSQNKLFDYLASGKPIISGEDNKYSVVRNEKCGIARAFQTPEDLVKAIQEIKDNPISEKHIRTVAEGYDFKVLTRRLLEIIDSCKG